VFSMKDPQAIEGVPTDGDPPAHVRTTSPIFSSKREIRRSSLS